MADPGKYQNERELRYQQQKEEKARARQLERNRQKQEQDRIRVAADFCMAAFRDGTISAAADRVAGRVSDDAWHTLYRKWKPFRCRWLAQLAQEMMEAKADIHSTFADIALKLSGRTLRHEPERVFAHQLLKNVPLPGDEQLVATAHGLRLVGVYLCAMRGFDLTSCACFRPLAIERTKEEVKQYLVVTGTSWTQRRVRGTSADPSN
jgi:hypothetical protein